MEKLTNIIEAILFASGASVPLSDIVEKLGVDRAEVKASLEELKEKYTSESGVQLLLFNNKAQLATNPDYKDEVSSVLNPIKEKEFTRTILECAAIVAYKQPITKTELEMIRGVNSDYAVKTLLDLEMITPCGRKDSVGKPILYATTDNFLKRFRLESLADLPDYDALMAQIAKQNGEEERDSYLYAKDTYSEEQSDKGKNDEEKKPREEDEAPADSLPDFLQGEDPDSIVTIE